MAGRPDKQRRKEMLDEIRSKERAAARARFPIPDEQLRLYFEMLDRELEKRDCDHTWRLTMAWLDQQGNAAEPFIQWLRDNGGFCDCEADINVRQIWKDANRDVAW